MKEVITKSTPLKKVLELSKVSCGKCSHCCKFDSCIILPEETARIARYLKLDEKEFIDNCLEEHRLFNKKVYKPVRIKKGKPYGVCIFFNTDRRCIIHPVKPLHCRIGTCNGYGEELAAWFALNYLVDPKDPESIRQWAMYLSSGGKNIPGGELSCLVPDKEKLKRILSFELLY